MATLKGFRPVRHDGSRLFTANSIDEAPDLNIDSGTVTATSGGIFLFLNPVRASRLMFIGCPGVNKHRLLVCEYDTDDILDSGGDTTPDLISGSDPQDYTIVYPFEDDPERGIRGTALGVYKSSGDPLWSNAWVKVSSVTVADELPFESWGGLAGMPGDTALPALQETLALYGFDDPVFEPPRISP